MCRCGEEEEPRVWICHTAGGLRGRFPSETRGEPLHSIKFTRLGKLIVAEEKKTQLAAQAKKNHSYNRKTSLDPVEQQRNLDMGWVGMACVFRCVYFHLPSSGDRAGGQLLEAKDWGGDQRVSQVEDLLQEEGERFILNAVFPENRSKPCSDTISWDLKFL